MYQKFLKLQKVSIPNVKKVITRKQSKLGYRASTSQMIQSNRISSLKRTKSEIVPRRSKVSKIRKSFKLGDGELLFFELIWF